MKKLFAVVLMLCLLAACVPALAESYTFDISSGTLRQDYTQTGVSDFARSLQSAKEAGDIIWGDANCDGGVSLADAVIIMQSIANPSAYGVTGSNDQHITEQGTKFGDVSETGNGITNKDALAIQKFCLKLIESLPEK